mgnify:CR=1 FL=1
MKNILIKIIKKYQSIPFKSHDSCKFIPTCSNYMIEALEEHGLIKGLFLGTKRLLRCNPFTNEKYTYDPVPKKKNNHLWQGMRESNSQQWFWRPLLYHLTNPLIIGTTK